MSQSKIKNKDYTKPLPDCPSMVQIVSFSSLTEGSEKSRHSKMQILCKKGVNNLFGLSRLNS